MRRAKRYELGPLTLADAEEALTRTAEGALTQEAAALAASMTFGYPYLVQLVGALAWDAAADRGAEAIEPQDVRAVSAQAIETMGYQVHHPSLKGVPPAQRAFLRAMAHRDLPARTTDVAEELGKPPAGISDTRSKLIDRELIYAPAWGYVDFVLPYMREFLLTDGRVTRLS